jgi:glycosyltransferase involved in cell wall biosynthesis
MYGKSVGGAELQFVELANYLAINHRVRLVSLGGDGALSNVPVHEDIEIRVYSYNSIVSAFPALLKAWADNFRNPVKTVVTTSFYGNLLGFLIGKFNKARLVSLQTVAVCMKYPVVDRFVLRRFDALIAGARGIQDYLIGHNQEPEYIHVVHNWVDFSKRLVTRTPSEVKESLGLGDRIVIGCIGRFHPQKGQLYLIRAYSRVVENFPGTVLVLVGDGETRGQLENEVSRLDLTGQVKFTGTVTGEDYNNILNTIDIYVQPSVFEGLPRTLLDAMYMGKAVVATDIDGNREVIEDETNGLLVPSKDPDEITRALLRLLNQRNEIRSFSEAARSTAVSQFGMENQLKKIEAIVF